MNAVELGQLLGEISAVDRRIVDEAVVLAWMPLVGDLDYSAAVEAVRLHRRETAAPIYPAHIRDNVARIYVAGLGTREDEYGNRIEPDQDALAAYRRINSRKAVEGS